MLEQKRSLENCWELPLRTTIERSNFSSAPFSNKNPPAFSLTSRLAALQSSLFVQGNCALSSAPTMAALRETNFPGLTPFARGKVRDIYDLGEQLLIVATDRLSAFDVV